MFEPEIFLKQCTVLKKVLVTLLGLFSSPAVISRPRRDVAPRSDSAPGELCLPCPPVVTPLHSIH